MLIFLKNANKIIFWLFSLASFICAIYAAVIISHFIWWVFSPSVPDLYVANLSVAKLDNSIKYIDNRNPFGIFVVVEPESVVKVESKPKVVIPHIDLSGIQVNGSYISANDKDSFAFVRVIDKSQKDSNHTPQSLLAQVGDQLIPGVFLKKIQKENIVVSVEGIESEIYFSSDEIAVHGINIEDVKQNPENPHTGYKRPLYIEPGPVVKEPARYRREPLNSLRNNGFRQNLRRNARSRAIYK